MTIDERRVSMALHDISKMILSAATMHRQHTSLLITLLQAGANPTDTVQELRANEEMFCGYLTRIASLADQMRLLFDRAQSPSTARTAPDDPTGFDAGRQV